MAVFSRKSKPSDQKVTNLVVGMHVFERFVVLRDPSSRLTQGGELFVTSDVADQTGSIRLVVWGVPQTREAEVLQFFQQGKVIVVAGQVKTYKGEKKLDSTYDDFCRHFRVCEDDEVTEQDFCTVKKSSRESGQMLSDLRVIISQMRVGTYRMICELFFDDETWVESFVQAVAARRRHHNWINGLLEHVWSMTRIAERLLELHPGDLDPDLLYAGILLHDLSKINDYHVGYVITMNPDQRYKRLGHMGGAQRVIEERLFRSGKSFDELEFQKLMHLILSHHGPVDVGFGSSVSPAIPEAWAMHFIDMLDAKVVEKIADMAINS